MSNFSFCHNVFKSHLLQMHQNASIGGKGLTEAIMSCFLSSFQSKRFSFKAVIKGIFINFNIALKRKMVTLDSPYLIKTMSLDACLLYDLQVHWICGTPKCPLYTYIVYPHQLALYDNIHLFSVLAFCYQDINFQNIIANV